MADFALDLRGRLRNFVLAPSNALVPLFEAVINGLHAIREAGRSDGRIIVEVRRGGPQGTLDLEGAPSAPILAFAVTDNGVGFNEENFASFCTSDTQKKAKIGGRGVGRLTWVKAFADVRVESVYRAPDGALRRRRFAFTETGIDEHGDEDVADRAVGTTILLEGMHPNFYKQLPKGLETIGQRMVDHFLVALRASDAQVTIEDGDDTFDVTEQIEQLHRTAEKSSVEVAGHVITLTHVKVASNEGRAHRLAYLADHRQVFSEGLAALIPHLKLRLHDDAGASFWSLTLAESPVFNETVSPQRDSFHFPDEPDPLFPELLSMARIKRAVVPKVAEHLTPFLGPLRERALSQAREHVQERAPQYRTVLKLKADEVAALPPDLAPEKLDSELRRIRFRHEEELRERAATLLEDGNATAEAYAELVSESNASAIDDLAKYVVDRRVILDLLRKAVRRDTQGKYALEAAIHKLVLPMRTTSDDVPFEQLNLWLIDERLAFHAHLASDKPLSSIGPIESNDPQRPDLLVFNRPIAFADQPAPNFQSVVVVEFKRPMRDDYDDSENPITQVYDYVRRVREGLAEQPGGRPFTVRPETPFYCYIVCDVTKRLHVQAKNYELQPSWDGQGYFGYNRGWHAYVEIMSFDKLIDDAEKRNLMFFEKLGLPKPR